MVPQQAGCRSPTGGSSLSVHAHRFPQHVWITTAAGAGVCSMTAAVVCPGSRWRRAGGQRPGLAHVRCPKDIRPRRSQRTSRYGADTAESCGRTGRGPPPPQARARAVMKVCQSAQRSADRSVQPRSQGRCTARLPPPCAGLPGDCFRPPVGSATRSNRRCTLPSLAAPQGAHKEGTGAAVLCPCRWCCSSPTPLTGAVRIAYAPASKRPCRSCRFL
jgi:hypothetical protein